MERIGIRFLTSQILIYGDEKLNYYIRFPGMFFTLLWFFLFINFFDNFYNSRRNIFKAQTKPKLKNSIISCMNFSTHKLKNRTFRFIFPSFKLQKEQEDFKWENHRDLSQAWATLLHTKGRRRTHRFREAVRGKKTARGKSLWSWHVL